MKHIIIGTAGHIDHGKTSLIKMLTGVDCDTHKEEKARGITINLGFTHIELPSGESAGIIDVPGHRDFINTMVGGACGIDLVLLVIAADSGIMPQTIEHIHIIQALGIKKGVVALTKIDLVDEELAEMAKYEISEFLKHTTLKNAPVIGVSSITGQGKHELIAAIDQEISTLEIQPRGNLFRMYIDRIFTVKGMGSVVTGSVLGGQIKTGDEVYLLPGKNQKYRIRSIERHGQAVDHVERGDRAALNIMGLKPGDIQRGMLISDRFWNPTEMADAYITLFENSPSLNIWSDVIFLTGTFETTARMHLLNKNVIKGGTDGIVQFHFKTPPILLHTDRFIIRNSAADMTLGGGYIIDASPLHHRKRTPQLIQTLEHLCISVLVENSIAENVKMLLNKEFIPMTEEEIAFKLAVHKDEIVGNIVQFPQDVIVHKNNNFYIFIAKQCENTYKTKIIKALQEHHSANPLLAKGLETVEILGKTGLAKHKTGKIYLEILLNQMMKETAVDKYENTWIVSGHKPTIDDKTLQQIEWLENYLLSCEDELPSMSIIEEMAAKENIQKQKIRQFLAYLHNSGKIKYFKDDFIHTEIANKYKMILLKNLINKTDGIKYDEYKSIIPCTKRMRAFLGEMFEAEKLIRFHYGKNIETRIEITETGKELLQNSNKK